MKLYVKYLVNEHFKTTVRDELKKLGLHFVIDEKGVVDVMENITSRQQKEIRTTLSGSGLELMDNKKAILIEKLKTTIKVMVRFMDNLAPADYPVYLSKKLKYDYACLALFFSEGEGATIENFISDQRIERVKELIIYDELGNKDISRKMHYGPVAHLSSHFKKSTGLTLSHFRNLENKRKILSEGVGNQQG